jgi:hypothetical protein
MTMTPGSVMQLCYVTHDLNRAIELWRDALGAGPFFTLVVPPDVGDRVYRGQPAQDSFKAALGFCGDTLIEFVEPINEAPSIWREILDTRGDMAVHHVMPNMRPLSALEYDQARDRYIARGYEPVLVMAMPGIGRCTLFDARQTLGSFVELMESSEAMHGGLSAMRRAHATWDGTRPIRAFEESLGA